MARLPASQYDSIADGYDSTDHPAAKLQHEMVSKAIGDCTRLSVLDLGGGTGIYARRAITQGAELVDVVDNSAEMLEKGRIIEATTSRTNTNGGIKGRIRWFEGDVGETLHNLPLLPEGYDVVMCNWVFNHANTNEELESMWRTASIHLKPGGKLVNIRVTDPFDTFPKYGTTMSELTSIPNGVKFKVRYLVDPPVEFEGTCLDDIATLSNDINHRNGFGDLEVLDPRDTDIVRNDEGFWEDHVKRPYFTVTIARKL